MPVSMPTLIGQLPGRRHSSSSAGAFSVGLPERFAANYKASQRFVERLEALSSTARALDAFRGSMAYQSWLDRWKLSVYYGLCFQACAVDGAQSSGWYVSCAGPEGCKATATP